MNMVDKDVQIIGVPLDLGAARRGTDGGPSALRIAGLGGSLARLGCRVSLEQDVSVPAMETRQPDQSRVRFKQEILNVCLQLAEITQSALDEAMLPLVIGGDHSIALGTVAGVSSYFLSRGERIGLVWFDAHADMNIPEHSPTGNIHGMPLAHLLGYGDEDLAGISGFKGKVRPENIALVGIRDVDREERRLIRESGISTFTMRDIDELGMARVSREVMRIVNHNTAGFHMSFDVDVCDPSVIPGCGTLVPGGVSFREAHLLMEYCADSGRMQSMEVVELNPFLDQSNVSAQRVISLIKSAFGSRIL